MRFSALLAVFAAISTGVVCAESEENEQQFWLSVKLDMINWREGCLTTALCSQPRFQLIKDLLPISERVSVNWPISEHFVKDSVRPFVSYWPSGRVEDISLSAQVVGIDRTYGFPRICDQTPSVRVFPEEHHKIIKEKIHSKELLSKPGNSLSLHIKGKCFNASVTITKHTERCPWCPDPAEVNIIQQEPMGHRSMGQVPWNSLFDDERIVHIGVLVLAIVAVLASTAFAVILVMYLRNKRVIKESLKKNKQRFQPYISVKGHEIEDNNRYDLPWEQQQRPLTYWMTSSNKSDSTMTSPLDSASSLAAGANIPNPEMYHSTYTRDGYQTYRPPPPSHPPIFPPQTQIYHHHNPSNYSTNRLTSPLSSSRHDDSGLESV